MAEFDPWQAAFGVAGSFGSSYLDMMGSSMASETAADASRYAADLEYAQYLQSRQDLSPYREVAMGQEIRDEDGQVIGYTGGALNQLAEYGMSHIDPNLFLPGTEVPEWGGSTIGELPEIQGQLPEFDIYGAPPEFNVTGDIPEFDQTQFDIYKDPSYEFIMDETMNQVDAAAASMGQVTSGNRLDETMQRASDVASTEYAAAYDRMVQDYDIQRQNEQEQYGRDVYGYGQDYAREADMYNRDISGYNINRENAMTEYGFDVDAWNRALALDTEQYGRDLTSYNADVAREQSMYGRGMDEFGLYYGMETDYLNRLAELAGIGQTASETTAVLGANAASNQANQIANAGAYEAGGQLGAANAWSSFFGDVADFGGQYFASSPSSGSGDDWLSWSYGGDYGGI